MTLKKYYEWLKAQGVKDDDDIIFVQDDGSGYTNEMSSTPIIEKFEDRKHGPTNGWNWDDLDPKWILGGGS